MSARLFALMLALSLILSPATSVSAVATPNEPNAAVAAVLATAVQVAAGSAHTCVLTAAGGVECWGWNGAGQLGNGTTTDSPLPVAVAGLASGVSAIAAGSSFACALTAAGGVQCWGANGSGQLGDGTTSTHTTPIAVNGLGSGVKAIAAGGSHVCALSASGGLRCWGRNTTGQLGDGTTYSRPSPVAVNGLSTGVSAVAAGENHTCALKTTGGIQCWGANDAGQLGNGTTATGRTIPGDVIGLASGVIAVAAGGSHTCALTGSGGMQCWGANGVGQLGDGTTNGGTTPDAVNGLAAGVTQIAAGWLHTCALTGAGGMQCWGLNDYYQLGDGTTDSRSAPINVSGLGAGVTGMTAGRQHTCAVTAAGGLKCWGRNDTGQVGDGTVAVRTIPAAVGGLDPIMTAVAGGTYHTCALSSAGGVRCWGENDAGQLGDGTATDRWTPADVAGLTTGVTSLAAGYGFSCASSAGGGVQCWGANDDGQLGDGTTTDGWIPVAVSGLVAPVIAVTAGDDHACALVAGGGVKCWGANGYGQLGNGTKVDHPTPVDVTGLASGVTAITAGRNHTCARTAAGGIKCWGRNDYGQLGDNTGTDRTTPVAVSGLTSGVSAITAGGSHTCALTTGGGAKCWGNNGHGQLGNGSTNGRLTPGDVSGLATGAIAIDAGDFHTCALTAGGGMMCWGWNSYGQVGDGMLIDRTSPAPVIGLDSGVTAITAGLLHTCAVTAGGSVKCWGYNNYGQLGVRSSAMPFYVVGFGRESRMTFLPVISR